RYNESQTSLAKLDIKTRRVVIISAYDPQQGCSDEEKDDFWQRLSDATQSVKEDEIVFVGGDLNGYVGSEHPSFQRNHGDLGIGTLNEDGASILDWPQAQDLALCNTFFVKRNSHLVTAYKQCQEGEGRTSKITAIEILGTARNVERFVKPYGHAAQETIVVGGIRYPVIREYGGRFFPRQSGS
ncbi:hypothetical protein GJ496_011200, partial [Pomphorhynchus laevis]